MSTSKVRALSTQESYLQEDKGFDRYSDARWVDFRRSLRRMERVAHLTKNHATRDTTPRYKGRSRVRKTANRHWRHGVRRPTKLRSCSSGPIDPFSQRSSFSDYARQSSTLSSFSFPFHERAPFSSRGIRYLVQNHQFRREHKVRCVQKQTN